MRRSILAAGACALAVAAPAGLLWAQGQTPQPKPEAAALREPGAVLGFTAAHAAAERATEARFDALIDPKEMAGWLERMASKPNQVGSPHDRENAEWQLAMFRSWGWDARIETFEVLYPTPLSESLELLGPTPYKAKLHEPAIASDPATSEPGQLPPYVAYQGDGDVTGELVYANYGMPDDYKALARQGVDVKGRIVIARYGGGWRGLKPKLAQEHGAIGCLIYSDPADDGYATADVYPRGGQRPPDGVQRGSVQDMTTYPGDPLTPGVGATKDAKRLTRETARTILKIPTLPISYGDAQPLLAALGGDVVPPNQRGALPITYRPGPGPARVHLAVKSEWSLKTIYDVIAVMKGSTEPDRWVIRGNHHDGWVFGASDPLSGQVALMAEAKAIGGLAKQGWRPKRTLVYASWDAEEPGLIGSTEWAETHAEELQAKAVAYVNSDENERGFLSVGGSGALQRFVGEAAADVADPQTKVSVRERQQAKIRAEAAGGNARMKRLAQAIGPGGDTPLEALGSGSDYSSFLQHLGIATLDVGFGGEGEDGGVYHSAYDSYVHYARFGDPGEAYGAALAKVVGRMTMRLADADAAPMRFTATAAHVAGWVDELGALAKDLREKNGETNRLIDSGAWTLAADPLTHARPPAREPVPPTFDFAPLEKAAARLKASAAAYDRAAAGADALPAARLAALNARLARQEQAFLDPGGLPGGRSWYRNLAYAPGAFTGYGAKTLPGVREAIEDGRYDDATRYITLTAHAIDRYAAALDQAAALLK